MNTQEMSDEELVVLFRNGHMPAGGVLFSRHKNSLYSFCLRMLRDPELAADAMQDTFMKIISSIGSLEKGGSFRAWMFAVARNEILMVLRRKKIVPMETFDDDDPVYNSPDPLEITLQNELMTTVGMAIGTLKPAYREIYLLRTTEGLRYDQIAQATGTTVSAVKSKLFKARAALITMLSPYMKDATS